MYEKMTAEECVKLGTKVLDGIAGDIGESFFLKKNMQSLNTAICHFTKAIELEPKKALAYCMRGTVFDLQERRLDAFFDYTVAIHLNQLNPADASIAYSMRGKLYDELGLTAEAISDYTMSLQLTPNDSNPGLYRDRAGCLLRSGKQLTTALSDYYNYLRLAVTVDSFIDDVFTCWASSIDDNIIFDHIKELPVKQQLSLLSQWLDETTELGFRFKNFEIKNGMLIKRSRYEDNSLLKEVEKYLETLNQIIFIFLIGQELITVDSISSDILFNITSLYWSTTEYTSISIEKGNLDKKLIVHENLPDTICQAMIKKGYGTSEECEQKLNKLKEIMQSGKDEKVLDKEEFYDELSISTNLRINEAEVDQKYELEKTSSIGSIENDTSLNKNPESNSTPLSQKSAKRDDLEIEGVQMLSEEINKAVLGKYSLSNSEPSFQNAGQQREKISIQKFLLYVCCFLDEITLPVAFFIPIIGQLYLGARLANNLQPLTNERYSFFGCYSTSQANNKSEECRLDWNLGYDNQPSEKIL